MRQEYEIAEIGRQLGTDAVEHAAHCAEQYCLRERTRLELTNEAKINALHVEGAAVTRAVRDIEERLRLAPCPGETRSRKRRVLYYWTTGILLAIAGFGFALVALAPFRLGSIGILYCVGIALVTPFATEAFLELWNRAHFVKTAAAAVFAAAIVGGTLLGSIRGQLLAREIEDPTPAVAIDGETPAPQSQQPSFYESTHSSLGWLLVLMALAIDLGSGVAIHRAIQFSKSGGEDSKGLSRELVKAQIRLGEIVHEMTALRNDPAIFEAGFWRDYYRAMLTQTMRKTITKAAFFGVLLLLVPLHIVAQQRLDVVIALDLSASEAVKDHDGKSEFSKNVQQVGKLLQIIPAGTKLMILGIDENSVREPYILFSAELTDDSGYFGERLTASRQHLERAWLSRARSLTPSSKGTDILGALFCASVWLDQRPNSDARVLIIYSDMRQATPVFSLEPKEQIGVRESLSTVRIHKMVADLHATSVYCIGAGAQIASVKEWKALQEFWLEYFKTTGASVKMFCNICIVPRFP